MFAKNSRYARLSVSSPVIASGERLRGTNLRVNPAVDGMFQHTVQRRDRLDLLALKYYREPTKWWQICDANPQFAFPLDLLDEAPMAEETFQLANEQSQLRFDNLIQALTTIGEVWNPNMDVSECSAALLALTPVNRTQVIGTIAAHGFHCLGSFSWSAGPSPGELFRFEDPVAKRDWTLLLRDVEQSPGVVDVQSFAQESRLDVVYNTAVIARDTLLLRLSLRSYAVVLSDSQSSERVGARIVIPPNQAT